MEAMDARRLRLYELLKPTLGEEGAKVLVLQLPARPEELATKADLDVLRSQILDHIDTRFAGFRGEVSGRFGDVDARFAELVGEMRGRFGEVDARFGDVDARFAELIGETRGRFGEV